MITGNDLEAFKPQEEDAPRLALGYQAAVAAGPAIPPLRQLPEESSGHVPHTRYVWDSVLTHI